MSALFRKKPIPVEALQLTPASFRQLVDKLTSAQFAGGGENTDGTVYLVIRTLEGIVQAGQGDWIVWGGHGDVWPVRGDIFAETYEPANEADAKGRLLDTFEAVAFTNYGPTDSLTANEYRCRKCGAIGGQGTDAKSLLDLMAMASRHECLPRVTDTTTGDNQ